MNDVHARIVSACINPATIEDIQAKTGVSKHTVYNLVARGMLTNIGTKHRGLYIVSEGISVEKEREFRPMKAIEQVASVWEYARRIYREVQHA